MKAAVALLVTASLAACFPNSAKHRTYAKIGEGAAIAAGIGVLAMSNSGADCDEMRMPGDDNSSCHSTASIMGGIGFGLILAGLTGFIATISTSPDDKPEAPANTLTPTPIAKDPATTDEPTAAALTKTSAAK